MKNEKINKVSKYLSQQKVKLMEMLPKKLRDEFMKEAYISGGCIYSLYNNLTPKDYDFFVKSSYFAQRLRSYFIALLPIDQILEFESSEGKNKIKIVYYNDVRVVITKNALSFNKEYQIITKFTGTPEKVVSEFDFCHNMFYYDNDEISAVSDWHYLEGNSLVYNEMRARDISGTIIRVHKFCERGMTITNGEMSKMLRKLRDVGFNERENEIIEHTSSY